MPEKNINVNFVKYEPYEHFPDIVAHLGRISDDELNEIMTTFSTHNIAPNACIQTLCLDFCDHTNFGRTIGCNNRYRTLDLGNMFYFDAMPQCGKQNCTLDETAKINRCARNLKNGKCRDEFIKNTLGAILYPQHYGKQR